MSITDTVNDLVTEVEEIKEDLGTTPGGVYANVRVRLDILENRISNPLAASPTVDNPFIIGNDGVTISTGDGEPSENRVDGSLFLRQDGYEHEGLYTRRDGYWVLANIFIGGGDISGDSTTQTVVGLQGRDVSNNAPGDGYVLTWDQSELQWVPAESSGGGSFTAGGDLSGNDSTQTVVGLQGRDVSSDVPGDGYVLTWDQSGSEWIPSVPADTFQVGGDLVGTSIYQEVERLNGAFAGNINAGSLKVGNYLTVDALSKPCSMSVTYSALFILRANDIYKLTIGGPNDNAIYRIPSQYTAITSGLTTTGGNGVCTDGYTLWVAVQLVSDSTIGYVLRIDLSDHSVIATQVNKCYNVIYEAASNHIWALSSNAGVVTLTQLDPTTNAITATLLPGLSTCGEMIFDSVQDLIWISGFGDFTKIDVMTATVTGIAITTGELTVPIGLTFIEYGGTGYIYYSNTTSNSVGQLNVVAGTIVTVGVADNIKSTTYDSTNERIILASLTGLKELTTLGPSVVLGASSISFPTTIASNPSFRVAYLLQFEAVAVTGPLICKLYLYDVSNPGIVLSSTFDAAGTVSFSAIVSLRDVPVSATTPTLGQTLRYDNTSWTPANMGGWTVIGAATSWLSSHNVVDTDTLIKVDCTGGAALVILPTSPVSGRTLYIKDILGSAGTNNITINGNTNNIDGNIEYVLTSNYQSVTLAYTGSQWSII